MDRYEAIGDGGCDVRWPAVDADDEARPAHEPDELQDRGMIEQIDAIFRHGDAAFGATDEHDTRGRQGVAKFLDCQIAE
jgi:hypothetical protein